MSMAAAARGGVERCLSSSAHTLAQDINKGMGFLDDGLFKLGSHTSSCAKNIYLLKGDETSAAQCATISAAFEAGRDAISGTRIFVVGHKAFTGEIWWQTTPEGWRRVKYEAGAPVKIPKSDLHNVWVKQPDGKWKNTYTTEESRDGIYIEQEGGGYILCDWMDIAMTILVIAARIIAPIRWLHNLKAYDLGRHANGLKGATMALWAAVLTLNLVQSLQNLSEEPDASMRQRRVWDVFQATIDLIALPFDFGLGANHPVLAAIGAGANIISATSLIVKEAVYYGG